MKDVDDLMGFFFFFFFGVIIWENFEFWQGDNMGTR